MPRPTPDNLYDLAVKQAQLLDCPTTNSKAIIDCLKTKPWRQLGDSLMGFYVNFYWLFQIWLFKYYHLNYANLLLNAIVPLLKQIKFISGIWIWSSFDMGTCCREGFRPRKIFTYRSSWSNSAGENACSSVHHQSDKRWILLDGIQYVVSYLNISPISAW